MTKLNRIESKSNLISHTAASSFIHTLTLSLASLTGIYRELCLESVKNKYECETQAASQHWEVRHTQIHTYNLYLTV